MNPKTVLVFAPHPDDEVIACGGSIIQHINKGDDVHILFSTDGRNSHSAVLNMHHNPSPEQLLLVRQKEAVRCAEVLGVQEKNLHFLGIEDTQMEQQQSKYVERLAEILETFEHIDKAYLPHDRREANIDHRLTGKLGIEALEKTGGSIEISKYVVWTLETEKEVSFSNRGSSYNPVDEADDNERMIEVDISGQLKQKIEAFAQHKTQITLYADEQQRPVLPEEFYKRICESTSEYFWQAVE